MAKHPGDIPKFKRLNEIKQIFERYGILDKNSLTQKVCLRLDVEEDSIKRVLYRDLEELVNLGFLREEFLTPDGARIDDFNPQLHKNYKKNWFIPGYQNQITGAGALENYGGKIICPSVLKNDLNLASNSLITTVRRRHIFFISSGMYFCLDIDLESLPINIVVLRRPENGEFEIHEHHTKSFGLRTVSLFLPNTTLSGFKLDRVGHFTIKLLADNSAELIDLKSKNGTFYYKLSHKEADLIREKGFQVGNETLTEDWNQYFPEKLIKERVENEKIDFPFIVEANYDSRFLLI